MVFSRYYYQGSERELGPFNQRQIIELIRQGALNSETRGRNAWIGKKWEPLGSFPEFVLELAVAKKRAEAAVLEAKRRQREIAKRARDAETAAENEAESRVAEQDWRMLYRTLYGGLISATIVSIALIIAIRPAAFSASWNFLLGKAGGASETLSATATPLLQPPAPGSETSVATPLSPVSAASEEVGPRPTAAEPVVDDAPPARTESVSPPPAETRPPPPAGEPEKKVYVKGYTRKDGVKVEGYYRRAPSKKRTSGQ